QSKRVARWPSKKRRSRTHVRDLLRSVDRLVVAIFVMDHLRVVSNSIGGKMHPSRCLCTSRLVPLPRVRICTFSTLVPGVQGSDVTSADIGIYRLGKSRHRDEGQEGRGG